MLSATNLTGLFDFEHQEYARFATRTATQLSSLATVGLGNAVGVQRSGPAAQWF
jgi:hypothetical protein